MSDSLSCLLSPPLTSSHTRKEPGRRCIQDNSGPCLSPSRHWGVELWRRSQNVTSRHSEPSIPAFDYHSNIPLPSNPAAFGLDTPLYRRPSTTTPRHQDRRPDPASSRDLDQLHLDALTELQKSIVEKGEGFIDKMRDLETHREREAMDDGGLRRSCSMTISRTSDPMDDSDDVMILDSAPDEEVSFWLPPRNKGPLSIDIMDGLDASPSEATPLALTDDDTESCSCDSIGAALTLDVLPYPTIPSSYPDKAISALALAFANGACGINDYQAVLDAYNSAHSMEESHAGELWD